ncbi:MAG: 50S ribosomal protein L17 [bacterium]|nr:50S ribosomal protein L17 [bacterium]
MHRHSYKGRKLSLKADQRRALLRGLVNSLILYERIETTMTKAKEIAPIFDRLVTKAKKGNLTNMRAVFSFSLSKTSAQKLIYELAEGFKDRNSGYTRIIKTGNRRGDSAPMAVIELILPKDFGKKPEQEKKEAKNIDLVQRSKPKKIQKAASGAKK